MSTERINQLHEEASERYLNGDYAGALKAWQDVLGLDPDNEQAQGGVRMASQFVPPDAAAAPSSPGPATAAAQAPDVEHDLEEGLKVLDGLEVTTMLEQDNDGSTDRQPAPEGVAELSREDVLDGWDMPASGPPAEESYGLEPLQSGTQTAASPISAAGAELMRRVDDLLAQAKAKAAAGERDEALAVLARLSILDEDNTEAAELRAKIEAEGASDLDKVENAIIEGVSALEADRLDDAEKHFQAALALSPEHREAKHYLEKVMERRAAGSEDLLGGAIGEAAPAEDAVAKAVPSEADAAKPVPLAKPARAPKPTTDVFDPPPAASAPRFALPPLKILVLGGVGLAAVVSAAIALPHLFGSGASKAAVPKPVAQVRKAARGAAAGAPAAGAQRVDPNSPEVAKSIAESVKNGRERMASGDFGGAVVAFSQALTLDPANADAKKGFEEAGQHYKAGKAEIDALNTIRLAYRDGEYTSGLRLAYRLPPTVSKTYVDGIKFAGWYNLAVVALRAGDCKGALTQLDEALQLAPDDAEAKSLKELATKYAEADKDRAFLDRVEALAFRPMPSS